MISSEIYRQLEAHGISKAEANRQYRFLTSGAHFVRLSQAAVINNGILPLSKNQAVNYANRYNKLSKSISIQKFVPASGAATRMFKELARFNKEGTISANITSLFASIEQLALYTLLPAKLAPAEMAAFLLNDLKLGTTPKGLVPFHRYTDNIRTAFEEHWVEGINYANTNNKAKIHFTVAGEHQHRFAKTLETKYIDYQEKYGVELAVSFSNQYKSTDTIAVDKEGQIVLNSQGEILLRPGGHGALIQNLNDLKADLVFVKNIDNVCHENNLASTILYKKALAGLLLELKEKVFEQLNSIKKGEPIIDELEQIGKSLMIKVSDDYSLLGEEDKVDFWKAKLNRPVRVCGMVKNEGEPGGGPFWVSGAHGTSLQIVESAQIDVSNDSQNKVLRQATHFNPVDLVCWVKDYEGNKFDLLEYVDDTTSFITTKSVDGKDIRVMERPGLWNGAMAQWNTIFVEVPIETFNPVKTINDLLKPQHHS